MELRSKDRLCVPPSPSRGPPLESAPPADG